MSGIITYVRNGCFVLFLCLFRSNGEGEDRIVSFLEFIFECDFTYFIFCVSFSKYTFGRNSILSHP